MKKAFLVFVSGLAFGLSLVVLHVYAQQQPAEIKPILTLRAQLEKAPPSIPGLDCARTAPTVFKVDQMASCPADRPFVNGLMYGKETNSGISNLAFNQIEWSFYCCKLTTTK